MSVLIEQDDGRKSSTVGYDYLLFANLQLIAGHIAASIKG